MGSATSWLALSAALAALAVTTPILIRRLGGPGFGLWVTLTTLLTYAGLADLGFAPAVAVFVGRYRSTGDVAGLSSFVTAAAAFYLVAFAAIVGLAWAAGPLVSTIIPIPPLDQPELRAAVVLLGGSAGLLVWLTALLNFLHAYQHLPLANTIRALYALGTAAALSGIALAGGRLAALSAGMLIVSVLACAGALMAVCSVARDLRPAWPPATQIRAIARFSGPMLLIVAGASIVFQSDNLIVAKFLGVGAVAAYAVAIRATRGLTQFLHKSADVFFPFYAGMKAISDMERIQRAYILSSRLEVVGAGALILVLGLAGRPALSLWVGAAGVTTDVTLALAFTLILLEAVIHPAAVLAGAIGRERGMAAANNFEAALNLALSLALVKPFGVAGVIAGTVIAQVATNLWILPRMVLRTLGLSSRRFVAETLKPTFVCAFPAALLGLASLRTMSGPWVPFVAAAAAVTMYAVIYAFAQSSDIERRWARRVLSRFTRVPGSD